MPQFTWPLVGGTPTPPTDFPDQPDADLEWDLARRRIAVDPAGDYRTVEGLEAVKQWFWMALATSPGEYRHAPEWGVGAEDFLKGPDTATARHQLRDRCITTLGTHERIERVVDVVIDRAWVGTQRVVIVTPIVKLRGTAEVQRLVLRYPEVI